MRILVCDGDVVEEKNLIRQNFVEQDVGRNKAQVLAERYSAAFGIECEYIPRFVESEEELFQLTVPDFFKSSYRGIPETQRVILLGCVDNNKSRKLCHAVFAKQKDLIYIDSGNGEHTGQVVCGVRQNGRTTYKPVCSLYPDILDDEDKFPSELSCAERAVSAPQSVTANLTAATAVVSFFVRPADLRRIENQVCHVFLPPDQYAGGMVNQEKESQGRLLKPPDRKEIENEETTFYHLPERTYGEPERAK